MLSSAEKVFLDRTELEIGRRRDAVHRGDREDLVRIANSLELKMARALTAALAHQAFKS